MSEENNNQNNNQNNAWNFEGKTIKKFAATGAAVLSQSIVNPNTDEEIAKMKHLLHWDSDRDFTALEKSKKLFVETRTGKDNSQTQKSSDVVAANVEFYKSLIQSGLLLIPDGYGEFKEAALSRPEMIEKARNLTAAISEIVNDWLNAGKTQIYFTDDSEVIDFFINPSDEVKILWYLGEREHPQAAAVFTFKRPTPDEQKQYRDNALAAVTSTRSDMNVTEYSANFGYRIRAGKKLLVNVEGVTIGDEAADFSPELKERFLTLFNLIWFARCVETLFEAFGKTKGKLENN